MVGPPSREVAGRSFYRLHGFRLGGVFLSPGEKTREGTMQKNDKNEQNKPVNLETPRQNDPVPGGMPVMRLLFAAGLCFGLLFVLAILKHVFHLF